MNTRWSDKEVQMIKDNPWWTPDVVAYYVPLETNIKRSVGSFARKQKELLGKVTKPMHIE